MVAQLADRQPLTTGCGSSPLCRPPMTITGPAMTFAAGLVGDGVEIENPGCVAKRFPDDVARPAAIRNARPRGASCGGGAQPLSRRLACASGVARPTPTRCDSASPLRR